MNWSKPRNFWQWLLVLTPAAEMIAVQTMADRSQTALAGESDILGLGVVILNVIGVFVFSLALGISWFWHSPDWVDRLVKGGAVGLVIGVVNITLGTVGPGIGHALFTKR